MAMPSSDHTTASRTSAMAPKNFRVRIVMAEMCNPFDLAQLAPGRGRTIRGAPNQTSASHASSFHRNRVPKYRRPLVADRRGHADRADGAGRRRHAADGVRALHRRVEAGDRHAAAADGGAMA